MRSIELFAGGGGLALGLERAGFEPALVTDSDKAACDTLRLNRPGWPVLEADIRRIDFTPLRGSVDLVAGGIPCQPFSTAGRGGGIRDTRGGMFFELIRAAAETQARAVLIENVRGLIGHDGGRALLAIQAALEVEGYQVAPPQLLNSADYGVAQLRERLFIVAARQGVEQFEWPQPQGRRYSLRDALFAGELYPDDVPPSAGERYPAAKAQVLALVPPGGSWRSLPPDTQRRYMGRGYFSSGGRTTTARRLDWDSPCLTLTCSPSQKKTERCHPSETRPLTIRESARVQSFPDSWQFCGSQAAQYRQIGNAIPVQLAEAIGEELARFLSLARQQPLDQISRLPAVVP